MLASRTLPTILLPDPVQPRVRQESADRLRWRTVPLLLTICRPNSSAALQIDTHAATPSIAGPPLGRSLPIKPWQPRSRSGVARHYRCAEVSIVLPAPGIPCRSHSRAAAAGSMLCQRGSFQRASAKFSRSARSTRGHCSCSCWAHLKAHVSAFMLCLFDPSLMDSHPSPVLDACTVSTCNDAFMATHVAKRPRSAVLIPGEGR